MFDNEQSVAKENEIKKSVDTSIGAVRKLAKWIAIPIVLLVLFNMFAFTVKEDEVAVVRKLGETKKVIVDRDNEVAESQNDYKEEFKNVKIVKDKGLFFKIPFITSVQKETSKLLTYIAQPENINTYDKKQYEVSFFAQYEITHPGLYQVKLGSISKANSILDDLIYPIVINRINQAQSESFLTEKDTMYLTLQNGMEELNKKVAQYGIQLKDIEVYRTILPQTNIQSTYNKMKAERDAAAQEIRSEGKEEYDKTVAEVDREVTETTSNAIEESERIKGEADAEALNIYAYGYEAEVKDSNGNVTGTKKMNGYLIDPEFYEFWRSLQAYKEAIDEDTTIYMDKNNPFLKYFTN